MKPRRPSLRAAIDAFCKHCIYDPGNGNGAWREQVQKCSSSNCPLWPVRPVSIGERLKPVSPPANDAPEVEPADDAEPSVDELLAQAFGGRG